jgi:uncharacterized protein CbrC (UPF0167 family)
MGGRSLSLPEFRYHPDPLLTRSVLVSTAECMACGQSRGYIYDGPAIAAEDYDLSFCPWCIAEGSVSERFGVEFTDVSHGIPGDVPSKTIQEIMSRTPGFFGWQQERWLYHCGDGAAFLGRAGIAELEIYHDAVQAIRTEGVDSGWGEDQIGAYVNSLRNDKSPSAYLFRCLACDRYLAYSDFT